MDLRRLAHLVALAEERHFGRAAERVHLSQPAFSGSIQALESEAGQRLFDRESGEVRPTPAGEFLLARARRLLLDARSLERELALYGDAQFGDVAFGVGPFPAALLMHRVVPRLRQEHPQVALRVEVNNWQLLLERLRAEDIEFFVADVRNFPGQADLAIRTLRREPAGFFVRAGHPLAGRRTSMAEVWRCGVATTRLPAVVKAGLAQALGVAEREVPGVALECDDVALLKSVALATDTVLGVIDGVVAEDLRSGALIRLSLRDEPRLYSEIGIVRLPHRSLSPMAQRVMEVIVATLDGLQAEPSRPQRTSMARKPPARGRP